MNKKILYIFILLIPLSIGLINLNSDDKATVESYLNGGGIIYKSETTEAPDLQTDNSVWTQGANMPAPTRYHGAGVGYSRNDTNWLICLSGDIDGSGNNTGVVSIYNATTNAWSTGTTGPATNVFYATASRIGQIAYLIGGIGPGGAFTSMVNEVKKYNIQTNTWLISAANYPITVASGGTGSAPYQDSLIYVVGGLGNGTNMAVNNVNLYNSISNTWRPCTPFPVMVWGGACAISGDTIVYVCGATGYSVPPTNSVYKGLINQSDRSIITWTNAAIYPGVARIRMTGANWGCKGIICGLGSNSGFGVSNEVYTYSPGANTWTPQPSYPVPTACTFFGSASRTGGIWRLMVASGLVLTPPYSIPQTNVMTDTLCPSPAFTCEMFTSTTFPPNSPGLWTLQYSGTLYWSRQIPSSFGIGQGSARYDMWNGPAGTNQSLISYNMQNLGSGMGIVLTMAYRPYSATGNPPYVQDSLIILASTNNGLTYYSIARLGPTQLQTTTTGSNMEFTNPANNEWLRRNYLLPIGTNKVQFMGKSQFGNHLYLDSICVSLFYDGIKPIGIIPGQYSLAQNYPNPFNPTTKIAFNLPTNRDVKLVVYDMLGKEVMTLVNGHMEAGIHTVEFDASNFASGVYFYRIEAGDFTDVKKMLLVK